MFGLWRQGTGTVRLRSRGKVSSVSQWRNRSGALAAALCASLLSGSVALANTERPWADRDASLAASALVPSVAVGADHACAVIAGGVRCWGGNAHGQLGDGTTVSTRTPVSVLVAPAGTPLTGVVALAAGTGFTCALMSDGGIHCWGAGSKGQLGNGATADSVSPVPVSGITGATAVTGGSAHACAIVAGGSVRCWGANASGQLGNGSKITRASPVAVASLSRATRVAAGAAHTCAALASGAVRCWGSNAKGQLGDGTTTTRTKPVSVRSLSGARELAAGARHTCARLAAGTAKCWGSNEKGQVGDGTTTTRKKPTAVKYLSGATRIAAGASHTCALRSGGAAKCWGANASGQVGDGTTTTRKTPVAVKLLTGGGSIAAGGAVTCAGKSTPAVYCWGANGRGQIGDGTTTTRKKPTAVKSLTPIVPTLATTASPPIVLGGSVTDTATLAGGSSPTGTLTFRLYGPDDATCTTAPAFTTTKAVTGNGSYTSASFTPTAVGTYRWIAAYGGDARHAAVSGTCNAAGESVIVTLPTITPKITPTLTTTASADTVPGGSLFDTAKLGGGSAPTGTLRFTLYGPDDPSCTKKVTSSDTEVTGNGTYTSTDLRSYVTEPGTYRYVASYSGDAKHNAVTTACNDPAEAIVVEPRLYPTKFSGPVSHRHHFEGSDSDGTVIDMTLTMEHRLNWELGTVLVHTDDDYLAYELTDPMVSIAWTYYYHSAGEDGGCHYEGSGVWEDRPASGDLFFVVWWNHPTLSGLDPSWQGGAPNEVFLDLAQAGGQEEPPGPTVTGHCWSEFGGGPSQTTVDLRDWLMMEYDPLLSLGVQQTIARVAATDSYKYTTNGLSEGFWEIDFAASCPCVPFDEVSEVPYSPTGTGTRSPAGLDSLAGPER